MNIRRFLLLTLGSWCVVSQAGCGKRDDIERYRVPKPHVLFEANHVEPPGGSDAQNRADVTSPLLTFDTPEGWSRGKVGGMRKAAFNVTDGQQRVEITVIDLPVAGGDLLPNVNRWRKQIQLDAFTQQELDTQIHEIQVGPTTGHYIELAGPENARRRESILGVIVIDSGRAWFFKLKGDAELAQREKERFETFVESVRFSRPDGAQ